MHAPSAAAGRNLLLTGRPGVGKTTVIVRLAEQLADRQVAGFYTEEIREAGRRQGFRAVTFAGGTTLLAHVAFDSRQHVGRYGVDVAAFERLVLSELTRPADVFLIDEIGKMECFSCRFTDAVRRLLGSPSAVVATVAASGGGFIAEVKARPDVEVFQVTHENRNDLPTRLGERLREALGR